jgi:hypothetical protein
MAQIPWPFTNSPGDEAQEGAGKLINVFVERRGDDQSITWRRVPGASVFVVEASVGAAAGSAISLGVSHIKEMLGAAAGTSAAPAVGRIVQVIQGTGQANGTSVATGSRSELVAVTGSASGTATAEAEGSP